MTTQSVIWEMNGGGMLSVSGWPNEQLRADYAVSCLKEVPVPIVGRSFHAPMTDDAFQIVDGDLDRATAAAEWAVAWIRSGVHVVSICREGLNRSCLVAALAVMKLGDLSGPQALEHVQARRAGSLYNWFFQEELRKRA